MKRYTIKVSTPEKDLIEAIRNGKPEVALKLLQALVSDQDPDYEDDDETIIEGIRQGLRDIKEGRVYPASTIWDDTIIE